AQKKRAPAEAEALIFIARLLKSAARDNRATVERLAHTVTGLHCKLRLTTRHGGAEFLALRGERIGNGVRTALAESLVIGVAARRIGVTDNRERTGSFSDDLVDHRLGFRRQVVLVETEIDGPRARSSRRLGAGGESFVERGLFSFNAFRLHRTAFTAEIGAVHAELVVARLFDPAVIVALCLGAGATTIRTAAIVERRHQLGAGVLQFGQIARKNSLRRGIVGEHGFAGSRSAALLDDRGRIDPVAVNIGFRSRPVLIFASQARVEGITLNVLMQVRFSCPGAATSQHKERTQRYKPGYHFHPNLRRYFALPPDITTGGPDPTGKPS